MPTYRPAMTVLVGGVPTVCTEVHVHEAINEVGTCTLVLALPAPAHVVVNAVVEVIATMTDAVTGATESATIFQGQTRGPERDDLTIRGRVKTLQAQGWLALMDLPHHEDVAFPGPIAARDVIAGLFADRAFGEAGRPSYHVDDLLTPAGGAVILGGEPLVDDGQVRVPAGRSESYCKFVARLCRLFGYAAYENGGMPKVSRIFGTPTGTSVKTFTEGVESMDWQGSTNLHDVVTWWEVLGPTIRGEDGTDTQIRSFPASVPASEDIPDPPDATRGDEADALLVTQALADAVRNVREIEYGERRRLARWQVRGQPGRWVGKRVTLDAPTVNLGTDVWVYSVDHDLTAAGGYVTTFTGSFGPGEALPAGSDVCVEETVLAGPTHVGDETIAWYAVGAPSGHEIVVPFTPLDDYTSITMVGRHHGTNSQFIDAQNVDLTVSRFQLWQDGEQIGEGAMPVASEEYERQSDYTNDANWSDFAVPIPGTLAGGVAAELRILSGHNPAATLGPWDDFEVKDVNLTSCAQGAPQLPTGPTSPTIPPPAPSPPNGPCVATLSGHVPPGASNGLLIPTFTIPAGDWRVRVRGSGSTLVALSWSAGGTPYTAPVHSVFLPLGTAEVPLFVPGTQTGHTAGTIKTGSGPFEHVWTRSSSVPLVVEDGFFLSRLQIHLSGSPEWPYDVADVCVTIEPL